MKNPKSKGLVLGLIGLIIILLSLWTFNKARPFLWGYSKEEGGDNAPAAINAALFSPDGRTIAFLTAAWRYRFATGFFTSLKSFPDGDGFKTSYSAFIIYLVPAVDNSKPVPFITIPLPEVAQNYRLLGWKGDEIFMDYYDPENHRYIKINTKTKEVSSFDRAEMIELEKDRPGVRNPNDPTQFVAYSYSNDFYVLGIYSNKDQGKQPVLVHTVFGPNVLKELQPKDVVENPFLTSNRERFK